MTGKQNRWVALTVLALCHGTGAAFPWQLVDDFESNPPLTGWTNIDVQNDTDPHVPNPQVSEVHSDPATGNRFMLRKPAPDGVVGNRKAIGFKPLPVAVQVGETYTFYTRINVEYFPNNQSFGVGNVPLAEIPEHHYDSFEPMIRITDKMESDGSKNDGTLMVLSGAKAYARIINPDTNRPARPLAPGQWYELWTVVNNAPRDAGGQRYDLYVRGGEFSEQQRVFTGADFRMQRQMPLTFFMAISNTGPRDAPYGNGGVRYDDIYMSPGRNLSSPLEKAVAGPADDRAQNPADQFDLRYWKLTLPTDADDDGKVDEISVGGLKTYSHPDFFYLDQQGSLVFTAPNRAATTANSTNTRSELRQMFRGTNTAIGTHDRKNNFALAANRRARKFADVGGQLEATLRVLQVAENARYPGKPSAYSVVVGQIHAIKDKDQVRRGFGYGNEPLKIFYKKWPGHEKGSVFWTYERNLAADDPDRTDIAYPVWGNSWDNADDPGEDGIALGEWFNYNVNVHGNVMVLTFRTMDPARTVRYRIDLTNNVDAYGKVDDRDNPKGYSGDALYFKAGAYNQCSAKDDSSFRYPACAGTGDWDTDRANGDFASVAFRRILLTRSVEPPPNGEGE
ncbi:MAG: polysaccharide lyase family 7 protein [Xanthomonadales bacterium]|nr:polysaccharide lyase family 7 protein [Xanthomonadales bacterium]